MVVVVVGYVWWVMDDKRSLSCEVDEVSVGVVTVRYSNAPGQRLELSGPGTESAARLQRDTH